MFKKFASVVPASAMLLSMGAASAQSAVPSQFKDSNGNSFNLNDVYSFECVAGGYKLQHTTEYTVLTYTDASNICSRVQNSAFYQTYFIPVNGTQRGINANQIRRAYIESSNTKVMRSGGPNDSFPGTTMHNAILARSN